MMGLDWRSNICCETGFDLNSSLTHTILLNAHADIHFLLSTVCASAIRFQLQQALPL